MDQSAFLWQRQPEAEAYLLEKLAAYAAESEQLAQLAEELREKSSTRLFDWLDHIGLVATAEEEAELLRLGFEEVERNGTWALFDHPGAQLPRVVLHHPDKHSHHGVALRVDSIAEFLATRGISCPIEGTPFGPYRQCCWSAEAGVGLWVAERRGQRSIVPPECSDHYQADYLKAQELWCTRPRNWVNQEASAFDETLKRAREMVSLVGADTAACIAMECERTYWQKRNRAAQVQRSRQDRLGLGWGNHDHHTFRSSRRYFSRLIEIFEVFGFSCRERFYAGKEAGWGAQVMENRNAGIVLFCDLDLSPEEVQIDFAHEELEELDHLGTIGLWCALHGESILEAGMHHLEGQFLFDELGMALQAEGITMMEPFSNFDHLKQAFTEGEMWPVQEVRLDALLERNLITEEEAEQFRSQGAVGSHLENLQRRDGFKGFNQQNVSYIIEKTDPRSITTLQGA